MKISIIENRHCCSTVNLLFPRNKCDYTYKRILFFSIHARNHGENRIPFVCVEITEFALIWSIPFRKFCISSTCCKMTRVFFFLRCCIIRIKIPLKMFQLVNLVTCNRIRNDLQRIKHIAFRRMTASFDINMKDTFHASERIAVLETIWKTYIGLMSAQSKTIEINWSSRSISIPIIRRFDS